MFVSFSAYEQVAFVNTEFHMIHLKWNVTYFGLRSSFSWFKHLWSFLTCYAGIELSNSGSWVGIVFFFFVFRTKVKTSSTISWTTNKPCTLVFWSFQGIWNENIGKKQYMNRFLVFNKERKRDNVVKGCVHYIFASLFYKSKK